MKTALRDYQLAIYNEARAALSKNRSCCLQLATGGGKTPVMAAICESVYTKGKRAWIVVPRKELLRQASNHLRRWSVPHGLINAENQESRAYNIHVVSKDTLTRRWNKIKNWPDIVLIDEGHLNIDFQKRIYAEAPATTKFILFTATPQRGDDRGLSTIAGGIADTLIEGPSIPELTARGFLCPLRYFSPPLDGLDKIKVNKFGEFDEESLEELLQRRKVYGDLVSHYERHGKGRAALIFCRSVKSAYHAAERFRERGHKAVAIDGTMTDLQIESILDKHRTGEITIICNCLLVTYGVDIPRVEYIGDISPTRSLSMYMQKIGRGLRPFPGKTDLVYMDHVNQILDHGVDDGTGRFIPPHFAPRIPWNFDGREKKKRGKKPKNVILCPHIDFMYCSTGNCGTCAHNPDKSVKDARKPMVVIPAELEEIKKPVPLAERPTEERREIQDRIGAAVLDYKATMGAGPVGELLKIAAELGYREMWVYWKLTEESRLTVNVPLLHEIARIRGYKPGWAYIAMQKIKAQKNIDKEYREVMG